MKRQKAKKNKKALKAHQPDEEQHHNTKTSVVVAGDSIIKYVKGWEL